MKTVICDIDGTLADCRHRLHHVLPHGGGGKRDWDAFFAEMGEDGVIWPVRDLVCAANAHYPVVVCTGRPEKYRAVTEAWLYDAGVSFRQLYMRPDNDTRPDHIVKAQILRGIIEDGFDPFIVIDDRQSVVDMWRDNGLVCLQAAPTEIEIPDTAVLTLMVGPSGGGKSTWVAANVPASHVLSSDQLRHDLCGDFRCQDRNDDVFAALHALARTRLKHGLPVCVDATNLRRKDRMTAAALAGGRAEVRYVVCNRPMAEKVRDGGWRNEVPGLLEKHQQTFRSQEKDILKGDGLPNVVVIDTRVVIPTTFGVAA